MGIQPTSAVSGPGSVAARWIVQPKTEVPEQAMGDLQTRTQEGTEILHQLGFPYLGLTTVSRADKGHEDEQVVCLCGEFRESQREGLPALVSEHLSHLFPKEGIAIGTTVDNDPGTLITFPYI